MLNKNKTHVSFDFHICFGQGSIDTYISLHDPFDFIPKQTAHSADDCHGRSGHNMATVVAGLCGVLALVNQLLSPCL